MQLLAEKNDKWGDVIEVGHSWAVQIGLHWNFAQGPDEIVF